MGSKQTRIVDTMYVRPPARDVVSSAKPIVGFVMKFGTGLLYKQLWNKGEFYANQRSEFIPVISIFLDRFVEIGYSEVCT